MFGIKAEITIAYKIMERIGRRLMQSCPALHFIFHETLKFVSCYYRHCTLFRTCYCYSASCLVGFDKKKD